MTHIVGIQFKGSGKVYYFDPLQFSFEVGEYVVVETVRGLELGKVIIPNRYVEDDQVEYELKPVIRKGTESDIIQDEKNIIKAKDAFEVFKNFVSVCDLEMKPLYAEYTIDQTKIIFYYSAEDRVDFRELLKLLTPEFKIRVELRQVGPREAARIIGGMGSCGRELCCCTHLQNFDYVTMKMAKEQGMSLNNTKISGACGKLMCCIAYENELYKEMKKEFPNIGTFVKTPSCESCKVVSVDYLKRIVKTQENPTGMPAVHKLEEVQEYKFAPRPDDSELIVSVSPNEKNNNLEENKQTNKEISSQNKKKHKSQPNPEKIIKIKEEKPNYNKRSRYERRKQKETNRVSK